MHAQCQEEFLSSLQCAVSLRGTVVKPENTSPEMLALAKAVRKAIAAYEKGGASYKIDDATSRILERDPDYVPPRKRREDKARSPVQNPGIFTVKRIAQRLGTTLGELMGEPGYELTSEDRNLLRGFVAWAANKVEASEDRGVGNRPAASLHRRAGKSTRTTLAAGGVVDLPEADATQTNADGSTQSTDAQDREKK